MVPIRRSASHGDEYLRLRRLARDAALIIPISGQIPSQKGHSFRHCSGPRASGVPEERTPENPTNQARSFPNACVFVRRWRRRTGVLARRPTAFCFVDQASLTSMPFNRATGSILLSAGSSLLHPKHRREPERQTRPIGDDDKEHQHYGLYRWMRPIAIGTRPLP